MATTTDDWAAKILAEVGPADAFRMSVRLREAVERSYKGRPLVVPAEVHDDDYRTQADFDAAPWFEQATREDLVELADDDFKLSEAADAVAEFFEDRHPLVWDVFGRKGDCGFECAVDRKAALRWVKEHRPDWYAAVLDAAGED